MIPLRDSLRSRSFPVVNVLLIVINVIIFFKELALPPRQLDHFLHIYGVIPAKIQHFLQVGSLDVLAYASLVTAIFVHGGWLHIIGNMLYLWVFGDNVEDRLGHGRYLLFYLLVGITGNLAHVLASSGSTVPTIGASGAVAGILGAYFVSFPRARILALVPVFFFLTVTEVPAIIFLFLWFILQLFNGFASLTMSGNVVAWWAHVGGFIAGLVLVQLFPKRRIYNY